MIGSHEKLILDLIQKNDGQWTWYQLERAVARCGGWDSEKSVTEVADSLVKRGYMSTVADAKYAHPIYKITESGVSAVGS